MQENVVYDTEETLELTGNAPPPKALAQKCRNILHVPAAMCYLHFVSHRKWQIISLLPLFLGGYLLWLSELGPRQQSSVPVQHAVTQRLQVAAARWSWKSVMTKISKQKKTSDLQKHLLVFPQVKFVPFNVKICKNKKQNKNHLHMWK